MPQLLCTSCLQPYWQKGDHPGHCPRCVRFVTEATLPNYKKTAADYYAEQQLNKFREESERQISDLHLSQEQIRSLRAQAEAVIAQLRKEVAALQVRSENQLQLLREEKSAFAEQHTLAEKRIAELEQQLARYQPDPNDSRDWTGDPFWAPPAVSAVVPATTSEEALADETLMRSLEQPGRLERFFDHSAVKAAIFAGSVAGAVIVEWLHH